MKKAFSNETDTYSYKLYSKFTKLVKLIVRN